MLLWTLGCMYLFKLEFSSFPNICPTFKLYKQAPCFFMLHFSLYPHKICLLVLIYSVNSLMHNFFPGFSKIAWIAAISNTFFSMFHTLHVVSRAHFCYYGIYLIFCLPKIKCMLQIWYCMLQYQLFSSYRKCEHL